MPQPVVKTQTRQRSVPKVVFDVRTITVSQKEVYLWRGKPRSAIPDVCREQVPTLVKETTRVPIVHEVQINVPRTITRQQAVQDPDQEVIEEVTIQMQQQVLNPAWHEPFTVQRVPVPVKTGKMVKQMRPVQKTVTQMQAVSVKRASDSFTPYALYASTWNKAPRISDTTSWAQVAVGQEQQVTDSILVPQMSMTSMTAEEQQMALAAAHYTPKPTSAQSFASGGSPQMMVSASHIKTG